MKYIVYLLILFSFFAIKAQNLDKLAEYNVEELSSKRGETVFVFKDKASSKRMKTVEICDMICKKFDCFSGNMMVEFLTLSDKKYYVSGFEFSEKINQICPVLVSDQIITNLSSQDTLRIEYSKSGKFDESQLNAILDNSVLNRIALSFSIKDKKEKEDCFSGYTLVFPMDKNEKRWIKNIKRISVLKIVKSGD